MPESASPTMKAARIHKFGAPLIIEDVARPEAAGDQALISVIACGVCHTDLHVTAGDMAGNPTLPFIPGHEIVGRVAALGKSAKGLAEGDLVGVPSLHWACGSCEFCKTGRETLCHKQLATGYSVDGGFAEYVTAPADFVVRIPENADPFQAAPILCAGVTTYTALKACGAKPGQWLAISGIGGLGHVAIQYARALGLHVAAIDIADEKLKLAEKLGAGLTVNALTENAAEKIQREIGGAHASLVTAASAEAFKSAVLALRRGGVCVLNGLPPGDFPLPICDVVLGGKTVRGSIIGTRRDMDEALEFALEHKIEVTVEKQPLENINEIFERLAAGDVVGRVVLDLIA